MSAHPATPSPANVETAIRQHSQDYVRFFNTGDFEALAKLYTPDAVLGPPNHEPVSGEKALRDLFRTFKEVGFESIKLEGERIEASGDVAARYGRYVAQLTDPKTKTKHEDRGKFIEVWRRQPDGSYRIQLDIWNSDLPPQA